MKTRWDELRCEWSHEYEAGNRAKWVRVTWGERWRKAEETSQGWWHFWHCRRVFHAYVAAHVTFAIYVKCTWQKIQPARSPPPFPWLFSTSFSTFLPFPGGQQNIWVSNTNQIKTNCGNERFIKLKPVRVPTRADAKWKIQFVATPPPISHADKK